MPTWDKILQEVESLNPMRVLDRYLTNLSRQTKRTSICYMTAFTVVKPPVPSLFHSIIDQDIQGFMTCSKGVNKDGLNLIVHTPGGDYEATKRIITYLHETYKHIRVYIPHMAMSGGTLFACSSDEIFMGPYSSIGPTDPQVFLDGNYIPVDALINEFNKAFEEVSSDPSTALLWNERLSKVPFGKLKAAENMRENSFKYLVDLLKTRNCWNKKDDEIDLIAKFLSSHEGHSSHGRGISLKDAKEIGLNVFDLREQKETEDIVLSIYHAAIILFNKTVAQKIIINNKKSRYINNYSQDHPIV
ncbi:MAG: S49 family peptidase [Thermodesulfobacteriota bacterium]|nr:S49 family peptidase [Thermodesulfobacteriota bacterium]